MSGSLLEERQSRLITASNMARWWGVDPVGVVENAKCHLGAALFNLDGTKELAVTCTPDPNTHILSVHLKGGLRNVFKTDGRVHFQGDHRSGDVVVIPAGQTPVAELREAGNAEIMHLYVPDALVRLAISEVSPATTVCEIKDHFAREDAETLRIALFVREEMRTPGLASNLLLDSMAAAIAVRIIRQWSNLSESHGQGVARGGLAPWQIRRVQDMINERLSEAIRLEELATAVGLSTFHFARAFKQSTGLPPHRAQTLARLNRARDLLANSQLGVLEIAISVGYESGQTLARAFRREFGCAPAEFRRLVA